MRTPTRLLILDYLRKQQTASVRDLSRSLDMTGANIRHHLAMLEANDVIELISQRGEGRGRPENVYSLSRRVLGDGLDDLAGALLAVCIRSMPAPVRDTSLQSLALRLASENNSNKDFLFPQRLSRMVDRLNVLHYQSRWEAGLKGPLIYLGHCPYAAIIAQNPELCRMDAILLEHLTGLPVHQTLKLQSNAKGYPYCAFNVNSNS
jgi:predicted ArsR family transcriptional regulator